MSLDLIPTVGPSSFPIVSLSLLLLFPLFSRERRTMACSSLLGTCFRTSAVKFKASYNEYCDPSQPKTDFQQIGFGKIPLLVANVSSGKLLHQSSSSSSSSPTCKQGFQHKSLVPLAASIAVLLCSTPTANAGLLSGSAGIESVPGPELPKIEFLNRFNEENQKKYAENDARFKDSPVLKQLLERSKLNKEKNRQAILDKYCLRGAEWGVGDCSTEGMTPDERDAFIAILKKRAGEE